MASAARWLIARGLGGIYISLRNFLKKWNKILEFGCIFLFEMFISYIKIMLVSLPALAMGLGGIFMGRGGARGGTCPPLEIQKYGGPPRII